MAKTAKLTEKQQRFVEEYLIDLNATQAAIRAGYSAKTADQQGSRMLANVKVQQAISVAMAERSKRTGINQDRVVLELARIAFVKMTDLVDSHGRIKDGASEDDLACIESVKYKQSESETGSSVEREVKISPKLKALELLGKHLGMWNDKIDVNITQAEMERLKKQKEEAQKEMLAQYDPFDTQNDDPDNKGDPSQGSQGGEVDE